MGDMDPLADLDAILPAIPKPVSDRALKMATRVGIPKEDLELFDSLANDPKLTDISQEIAYLRYLRVKLQQSIEARRDVMVVELGRRMLDGFDQYLWSQSSPVPEGLKSVVRDWMKTILERLLNEHFPIMDLDRATLLPSGTWWSPWGSWPRSGRKSPRASPSRSSPTKTNSS